MNTAFPEVTAGTTATSGTADYVVDVTALSFAGVPTSDLNGRLVEYFVRYPDNVTAGYESGSGIYTHSSRTIARTNIYESSNSDAKVSWPDTTLKHIGLTVSGATLGNMARVFASLAPHENILVGLTGQSNGASVSAFYTGAGPADTTRVKDWSRIANNTGDPAWRDVVKADEYTYATNPHLGTYRSVQDGTWKKTGSIIHSFATQLATLTGRIVRTVSVTRGGTSLNEPTYGWGYLPSVGTAVSKVFKDSVDAAIAALPADQASITKLHLYLFVQGESDAVINDEDTPYWTSPSNKYGYLLADHLKALEDTTRWNIADSKTIYLLFDIPRSARSERTYVAAGSAEFDGHAQAAALFGPRAIVIQANDVPMGDVLHYSGEGADMVGAGAANTLLSNSHAHGNTGGAFRLAKNNTWPDPSYNFRADGAGAPASNDMLFNVGRTEIKINNTSPQGDMNAAGLGNFKVGDVLRVVKSTDAGIYVDSTITGLPTNNTTWWSYPCTSNSVGTLVAADVVFIKPQNTSFHDGKSYTAATPHNIQSAKQNLVNVDTVYSAGAAAVGGAEVYRNHHVIMVNEQGRQYRSRKLGARGGSLRTPQAAATILCRSYHFEDGRVEYVRATVCYKIPANGNVGVFIVEGVLRCTTTATVDWSTVTQVVDEEALATNPTFTATTFAGAIEGWAINVTGKTSTNIDWTCEVETIVIPTSA